MRILMRFILILAAATLMAQSTPSPLVNSDFESGAVGGPLPGWGIGIPVFRAETSDQDCNSGKQCGLLRPAGTAAVTSDVFGNIVQVLNAAPYRGKKIRFRAAVRLQGSPQDRAQLWLRVDRQGGAVGFFDNMSDRPVMPVNSWSFYEIIGDVDADASTINLGLLMRGNGRSWIDDAAFEVIGNSDPLEPARTLTTRGLQNLQALARLYGYVHYFHPSDEAAAADWNRLAIDSVRVVESAATPEELATRLQNVFGPVAPGVRIFLTGTTAPVIDQKKTENVVVWEHHGVGLVPQGIYRSTRVIQPASQSADRLEPLRADLPGGVSAIIPMALYRDDTGVRPAAMAPLRPTGSANDRATRLAAVIVTWNVFEHFYPYFDVVQTDWPQVLRTSLSAAAEDKDAEQFKATLSKLVAGLHDGHGQVSGGSTSAMAVPPVGLTWADGRVVVLYSLGQTGIAPGDAILSIDGRPVADLMAERQAQISGATPQWIRYRMLTELLAHPPGTNVVVEIEPFAEPNSRRSVSLRAASSPAAVAEDPQRPAKVKEMEPGIFYLDMNKLTDADFAGVLPSLLNAKGIVFDMRGYPRLQNIGEFFGHLIDKPSTSAQWNVPNVTRPDHDRMTFVREGEWQLRPVAPFFQAKRAFIIDGRAISYAESVMGIVENYKLAEIVGEPTAGTNGNINPFPIPGGFTVAWTGMKVLKQDGSQHHGIGILPTIPVSRTRAGIAAGRDEQLERAIQAVK